MIYLTQIEVGLNPNTLIIVVEHTIIKQKSTFKKTKNCQDKTFRPNTHEFWSREKWCKTLSIANKTEPKASTPSVEVHADHFYS